MHPSTLSLPPSFLYPRCACSFTHTAVIRICPPNTPPPESFAHLAATPSHLEIGSDGVPSPARRSLAGASLVGGGCPMRSLAGALADDGPSREGEVRTLNPELLNPQI